MNERPNDEMNVQIIEKDPQELMSFDYDNVIQVADRADRMVAALKKIMTAAIKITTNKDWTIIGGTPYLQESGATKVARLFGIGWKILDQKTELDRDGYPTYTYKMRFRMGGTEIEAEGSRSAKDEFFAGRGDKRKSVDEVKLRDVKQAAYTNCLNNGIKRILPGLRNLEVADLEAQGIHPASGYTFKTGSRGGNSGKAEDSGLVCSGCGKPVTQAEASYSQSKFGAILCRGCQSKSRGGSTAKGGLRTDDFQTPPHGDEDLPF